MTIILISVALSVKAAEVGVPECMPDSTLLSEVVVTATRTPRSLKDVPVVTRVITGDEIKKTDATDIQELLTEELPGLEFGFSMSQETTLNMNGFGGSSVLFLVDGERLAGETMDNVDYSRLQLAGVGRVEIVKGASSALYGANAVGGVVNLITDRNRSPWHASADFRWRSVGKEWRAGTQFGFDRGNWNSSTSVRFKSAETVRLTDDFDTRSNIRFIYGGTTFDVSERVVFEPSEGVRLTARGGYFRRESERSNYTDRYEDVSAGLRGNFTLPHGGALEVSGTFDRYDKLRFESGERTHAHDYSNRQSTVRALYIYVSGRNTITAGADFMYDYLSTYQFADGGSRSQKTFDVFVQMECRIKSWLNVVAGIRDDYFSASRNNAFTGRLAALFKLKPLSVRASYSGGFRAPTLKEMYMSFDMAGIQMIYGNPDLQPERSHNFALSGERNGFVYEGCLAGTYSLTCSGSYNVYDRRITTTDFNGDDGREAGAIYCNESGVRVAGAEVCMRYKTRNGIGASVSYNYLHTIGRKTDSQFSQPRPHSATWRVDYEKSLRGNYGFYAAVSGRYLSKADSRFATAGACSVWKLTLRQSFGKGLDVNFAIDNLWGYRPGIYYWNTPPVAGRSWSVGVSVDVDKLFN